MPSDHCGQRSTMISWRPHLIIHQRLARFQFIYNNRRARSKFLTQCSFHRIEGGKCWEKELNRLLLVIE